MSTDISTDIGTEGSTGFSTEDSVSNVDAIAALLEGGSEESDSAEETDNESTDDEGLGIEGAEGDDDPQDEPASDEDDEDDEEDSGEGDGPEPDIDTQEFTVIINGEEVKVKGDELKSGYMRQAAFTKKTQEVAEERKELTKELTKVSEQADVVRFQAYNKMQQFEDALSQVGGWDQLRLTYPPDQVEEFTKQYASAQGEAKYCDDLIDQYSQRIRDQNVREITGILNNLAATTHGFTSDTFSQMDKYLVDNGFSQEMLVQITNPNAWEMIYKAMKYDAAQSNTRTSKVAQKEAKLKGRSRHSAPTTPVPVGNKQRKLSKAIAQQKKTGGTGRAGEQATEAALVALLGGK